MTELAFTVMTKEELDFFWSKHIVLSEVKLLVLCKTVEEPFLLLLSDLEGAESKIKKRKVKRVSWKRLGGIFNVYKRTLFGVEDSHKESYLKKGTPPSSSDVALSTEVDGSSPHTTIPTAITTNKED